MYEVNEGDSSKGPADAAVWYAAAAKKGHVQAAHWLASLYEMGIGVPQNYDEAVRWYKKAGEENNFIPSLAALAHLYEEGNGVDKDLEKARALYQKGADAGNAVSQLALGRFYKNGIGGAADPVAAYQWFALAANALPEGEDKNTAVVSRIETANALSESQLNDARQRVRDWQPVVPPAPPAGQQPSP
jgi:TPR repeat protein